MDDQAIAKPTERLTRARAVPSYMRATASSAAKAVPSATGPSRAARGLGSAPRSSKLSAQSPGESSLLNYFDRIPPTAETTMRTDSPSSNYKQTASKMMQPEVNDDVRAKNSEKSWRGGAAAGGGGDGLGLPLADRARRAAGRRDMDDDDDGGYVNEFDDDELLDDIEGERRRGYRGTPVLPFELFGDIVRVSHPVVGRNIRCMSKQLSYIITRKDLMWGEAGWRLHRNAGDCWWWATKSGHVEVVRLLLEFGADVHAGGDAALRAASPRGHHEVVRLLLENGANVHAKDDSALRGASQRGHFEVVRLLLEHGANVHAKNDCALRQASQNGHLKVVRPLLENGANVHAKDDSALCQASLKGHLKVVRSLLENGANVHAADDSALRGASQNGHLEVVRLLLENGANVHAKDDSALCMASHNGHLDVVRLLLENGADHREAVHFLLESGADGEKPCV
ncbi:hypothetical protein HK104_004126 [Borealophlyctis nickersoniae]|nr:hypothetical protein HK104_004126 [Borealophlyctis nickersoniae]